MISLTRLTKPRQKINLLIAALFVAVQLPLLSFISKTSANTNTYYPVTEDKVAVCHATKSSTNPYSNLNNPGPQVVDKSSVIQVTGPDDTVSYSGHGEHVGPLFPQTDDKGNWGDIIPPFLYQKNKNSVVVTYPGLNWTTAGQAYFYNNCLAPITTGSVTIVKDVQPGMDSQNFNFTGGTVSNPTQESFNLDDDNDNTLSNSKLYNELAAGQYTVSETAIDGWNVSVSCTNTTGIVTNNGRTATFTLAAGANVVCTFVNEKQAQMAETGSITIIKDADPNNLQDFIFSATGIDGTTGFTLDDDGDETNTNKRSVTYENLPANEEYTFTETPTEGWTLASITCDTTEGITVAIPKVTIDLAEGADVSCTFVNTLNQTTGQVLGDNVTVTQQVTAAAVGGAGAVLGAQTQAPVGGVSAGFGGATQAGASLSSFAGLATSLSALGYGVVASLRKRQ